MIITQLHIDQNIPWRLIDLEGDRTARSYGVSRAIVSRLCKMRRIYVICCQGD